MSEAKESTFSARIKALRADIRETLRRGGASAEEIAVFEDRPLEDSKAVCCGLHLQSEIVVFMRVCGTDTSSSSTAAHDFGTAKGSTSESHQGREGARKSSGFRIYALLSLQLTHLPQIEEYENKLRTHVIIEEEDAAVAEVEETHQAKL